MFRKMRINTLLLAGSILILSANVNAVVLNTLNGVNYEWLELTETAGLSRNEVELRLNDVNDSLYGYEYASRLLMESLLQSYSTWDGLDGYHGDSSVLSGLDAYFEDFGRLYVYAGNGTNTEHSVVDGEQLVNYDGYSRNYGLFGAINDCGDITQTCYSAISLFSDASGTPSMTSMDGRYGWDSTNPSPISYGVNNSRADMGSQLVRINVNAVPVPAAVWLFGSGLIGLVGLARRKK